MALVLLVGTATAAPAIDWIIADNTDKVDIVSDDVAVASVESPHYLNVGAVTDATVDLSKGIAYVTTEFPRPTDDTPVTVVDLVRRSVVAVVTDPQHLLTDKNGTWAIVLSPDGRRVYYTNPYELVEVDTSSNQVVATVSIANFAYGVRISPDGQRAYVRSVNSTSSVSVVDLATHQVTGSVVIPGPGSCCSSSSFILDADGSTLYTLSGSEVWSVDTATLTPSVFSDPTHQIQGPAGLTLAAGNLFVSNLLPFNFTNCPENQDFHSNVVVADTATATVTGVIAIPGNTNVTFALGTSLDESQIYVGYNPANPTKATCESSVTIGIIDPNAESGAGAFVGTVSDPLGLIVDAQTAVDPFIPSSNVAKKCAAGKRKASGKKIAGKLMCYVVAKASGQAVDAACLAKVEQSFATKFVTLGSSCPGDANGIEALVDTCVDALLADLPGDGQCPAAALGAVAKAGKKSMGCAAKDIKKPGSAAKCYASASTKLAAALSIAGACSTPSVETDLDADCVKPVRQALPLVETGSTTTTPTTSTTSTT
jgi:hypothetical protein